MAFAHRRFLIQLMNAHQGNASAEAPPKNVNDSVLNNSVLNVKTYIFCLLNYVTQVTDFKKKVDEAQMLWQYKYCMIFRAEI